MEQPRRLLLLDSWFNHGNTFCKTFFLRKYWKPKEVESLVDDGVAMSVVTLGDNGCNYYTEVVRVPIKTYREQKTSLEGLMRRGMERFSWEKNLRDHCTNLQLYYVDDETSWYVVGNESFRICTQTHVELKHIPTK